MRPTRMLAIFAALSLLLEPLSNLATGMIHLSGGWAPWVLTATALVLVVAITMELRHYRSSEPASVPEPLALDEAARTLAQAVEVQWQREEERRRIHDPFPLPVHWHPAPERLIDHWPNIHRAPGGADPGPLPLAGRLDQITSVYERIPSGRLLVLGSAGSGKTILTLRFVLDRLAVRCDADPVPVIFHLGSWDPTASTVRDWLAGQLIRDYPGLFAPTPNAIELATALVDTGRVLPVLDGFDEISRGLHLPALQALSATTMPMLLTSRPNEYAAAVNTADVLLTAAAGIELDDLTVADLAEYLPRTARRSASASAETRWNPVLDWLAGNPADPRAGKVIGVLSTPLMVTLARINYSDSPGHDPADLLDTQRFPTAHSLRDHLLATFIASVYREPGLGERASLRWRPDQIQRWLGFLASHLDALGTRDLAWWQLGDTISTHTRTLLFAGVAAMVAAVAFGLPLGVIAAPPAGLAGVLVIIVLAGLLAGFAVGAVVWLVEELAIGRRQPARTQLRGQTRQALIMLATMLAMGLVIGLGVGLHDRNSVGGLAAGLAIGLASGPAFVVITGLEAPVDIRAAISTWEVLAFDRKNTIFQLCAGGLVFGLVIGSVGQIDLDLPTTQFPTTSRFGLVPWLVALLAGIFVSLGVLVAKSWGRWLILVRLWLPMTGRLPWQVVAFLNDAHQRGVLREAGAVYQFRHGRIQDFLARGQQS